MAESSPAPHAQMVLLAGEQQGRSIDLTDDHVFFAIRQVSRRRDDVELVVEAEIPELDRLAALVRTGPGRYEVHNLRPWDDVLLNGTRKVPFGARPLIHDGDTVTVRGLVCQFMQKVESPESLDDSSLPPLSEMSGVAPGIETLVEGAFDIDSEIVASREVSPDSSVADEAPDEIGRLRRTTQILERLPELAGLVETKPFFQRFLSLILDAFPGARGTVLVFDERQKSLRRVAAIPEGGKEIRVSRAVVKRVQKQREAVLSKDTLSDEVLKMRDSVLNFRMRSVVCVPILHGSEFYGVIHLDADGVSAFEETDLAVLAGIAPQAVLALENARALKRLRMRDLAREESVLARNLQQGLLPHPLPEVEGLELASRVLHAEQTGGDFFDAFSSAGGKGGVFFIGHTDLRGVAATIFLKGIRSALRAYAEVSNSPKDILGRLSRRIQADEPPDRTMTGLLLFWNLEQGQFAVSGAGHVPLLLFQTAGQRCIESSLGGRAMGEASSEGANSQAMDRGLQPASGDVLVLSSPGALSVSDELNVAVLTEVVESCAGKSADEVADRLALEVTSRVPQEDLAEDVAFLVIKRA